MRIVEKFDEIKRREVRDGKCPVCNRPVRRSITLSETINPFNRNAAGLPKTEFEIKVSLAKKASEWVPDFRHEGCRD